MYQDTGNETTQERCDSYLHYYYINNPKKPAWNLCSRVARLQARELEMERKLKDLDKHQSNKGKQSEMVRKAK